MKLVIYKNHCAGSSVGTAHNILWGNVRQLRVPCVCVRISVELPVQRCTLTHNTVTHGNWKIVPLNSNCLINISVRFSPLKSMDVTKPVVPVSVKHLEDTAVQHYATLQPNTQTRHNCDILMDFIHLWHLNLPPRRNVMQLRLVVWYRCNETAYQFHLKGYSSPNWFHLHGYSS